MITSSVTIRHTIVANPAGDATAGLDIFSGPYRSRFPGVEVTGHETRTSVSSAYGPRITVRFDDGSFPEVGEVVVIEMVIVGEPIAGEDIVVEQIGESQVDLLDLAPCFKPWKTIYEQRRDNSVKKPQKFFFNLDCRTLAALRVCSDLPSLDVDPMVDAITDRLFKRLAERHAQPHPAKLEQSLFQLSPEQAAWVHDQFAGALEYASMGAPELPAAMEAFGAGRLRQELYWAVDHVHAAADANSWNVFFFAEVGLAVHEHNPDSDLWSPALLHSLVKMQTLFLARQPQLARVQHYMVPGPPVPDEMEKVITWLYDLLVPKDIKGIEERFHENLRVAGPEGM